MWLKSILCSMDFPRTVLRLSLTTLLLALIAGCVNLQPTPTPLPLPALAGRLIFETDNTYDDRDHRLWQALPQTGEQVAQEVTGDQPTLSKGADPFKCLDQARGVFCTYSPVGPYSLDPIGTKWRQTDWSTRNIGFLIDRDTGAELDPAGTACEAVWRDDGQMVAVVTRDGVYVAGTDMMAIRVLERPREFYTEAGTTTLGLPSQYVLYAALSCPVWITPEDLLISRYSGSFPSSVTLPKPIAGQGIAIHGTPPDMTSVVHLAPSGVEVRDLTDLWQVAVIDPKGRYIVLNLLRPNSKMLSGYYLADPAILADGQDQKFILLEGCSKATPCNNFEFNTKSRSVAFSVDRGSDNKTIEIWIGDMGVFKSISVQPQLSPRELFWSPRGDALAIAYNTPPEVYLFVLEGERVAHLQIDFLKQEGLFFELAGWVEP